MATNCEKCGAHYEPTELIDPVSTLSGTKPETREADHLFVNIEKLHGFLNEWTQSGSLQPEIANFCTATSSARPLHDWGRLAARALFRLRDSDAPGQYLVRSGFDAPIGYMGSTLQWCKSGTAERFEDWWRSVETEVHHFIGKGHQRFPHALLAGHAARRGLQPAREGPHSWLS